MRVFLQVIGVLAALAAITFFMLAIWTGDARWAGTAFVAQMSAVGSFAAAFEFPPSVPHSEKCSGC